MAAHPNIEMQSRRHKNSERDVTGFVIELTLASLNLSVGKEEL